MVKRIGKIVRLLIILFFSFEINADDTATKVFSPRFRSLKTEVMDNFMSPPIIRLESGERIQVSFDEIGDDVSYLSARLIHCNSDWQPSSLVESEYLDSFNTVDIEDYAFSTNTFIHYINYQLQLPCEGMNPIKSGNYLLQVYDREAPDKLLLQTRFRIVEAELGVEAKVTSRTDRGANDRFQQLAVALNGVSQEMGNPYQDVRVEVMQNNRAATSRFLTSPLRVEGERVIYEHRPELIFPASNEYRRFESTSTRFPGMGVDSTRYEEPLYHSWVAPDVPRSDRNYEYDSTQHGRFIVKEYNATDSSIGADYINVHFFLDTPEYIGQEVYIDGEFTVGLLNEATRMRYNGVRGGYELEIPLKQGAYNYQYVTRPQGEQSVAIPSLIEGDKYETNNEYNIYVYLRKPGERYDRLVGYTTVYMN